MTPKCNSVFFSKKIHHPGDKVHPSEVKALLTNGTIKSSVDLKPTSKEININCTKNDANNETSIMNLLLAAAAKSSKNHQPNGMVKAASTSELEASNSHASQHDPELQLDDHDHDHGHDHHYPHHHHVQCLLSQKVQSAHVLESCLRGY